MLLSEPPRSQFDIRFPLFGIPVRVSPLFWLTGVFLNLRCSDLFEMLIWLAAVFISVLVHEMGHATAARAYGGYPSITLHTFGGVTSYDESSSFGGRAWSPWARIKLSAAGPLAGFLLAAVIIGALQLSGHRLAHHGFLGLILMPMDQAFPDWFTTFVWDLQFTSIYWGLFNLLPILPLDGGQIARELLVTINRRDGVRQSLVLSIAAAVVLAVLAWTQWRDGFLTLFLALLAYESYSALQAFGGRGPW